MKHYKFAVAEDGTRYILEHRGAADPEPDQPIDDSINGKLDRIIAELAALRKGTTAADGDTETILTTPGVGNLLPVTIKKVGGEIDQQFGFDDENLNPEIKNYIKKHNLTGAV
jgi:hypothetical protein